MTVAPYGTNHTQWTQLHVTIEQSFSHPPSPPAEDKPSSTLPSQGKVVQKAGARGPPPHRWVSLALVPRCGVLLSDSEDDVPGAGRPHCLHSSCWVTHRAPPDALVVKEMKPRSLLASPTLFSCLFSFIEVILTSKICICISRTT